MAVPVRRTDGHHACSSASISRGGRWRVPATRSPCRQSRSLMAGAGGGTRTPTGLAALRIFLPATAFAAARMGVCGLDYPFTMPRDRGVGAARLVSTPSRQPVAWSAWLGIATLEVSPNLSSSASSVSGGALKFLSPLRLPVPPRPLYSGDQLLSAFTGEVE